MSENRAKRYIQHTGLFTLLLFLLILSLFKPAGVEDISYLKPVDLVLSVGQYIAVPATIWLYRDRAINSYIAAVSLLLLTLLIYSVINEGHIAFDTQLYNWLKIIIGCMLVESCLRTDRIIPFLKACYISCLLILITNLIMTFVVNPGGIYSEFQIDLRGECFFGDKNSVRNPAIVGFASSCINDFIDNKRCSKQSILMLLLGMASVVLVGSATSAVVMALICIAYFLIVTRQYFPDIRLMSILISIIWVIVVFVRKLPFIEGFVVNVLQRDVTFSGRTYIWDATLSEIIDNPFEGHGLNARIPVAWNLGYVTHAHNYYLDVLYKGGLIAIALQLYIQISALYRLYLFNSVEISKVLALLVLSFTFAGIFGSLNNPFFYMILCLGFNVDDIIVLEAKLNEYKGNSYESRH